MIRFCPCCGVERLVLLGLQIHQCIGCHTFHEIIEVDVVDVLAAGLDIEEG